MEADRFSETKFVVGFLREYFSFLGDPFWLFSSFRMPSTVTESKTGADFILNGSVFFQFKRSDYLQSRRGLPSDQRRISKSFYPCYRFKVYNSSHTKQFDTLRLLATDKRNHCAYIAPLFHTSREFDEYFSQQSIFRNSVSIELSQFSEGEFRGSRFREGATHHIIFNRKNETCWFCSNPRKITAESAYQLLQRPFQERILLSEYLDDISKGYNN